MKAGIAIDDWKLDIFERRLTQAGYSYEKGPGIVTGTLFLTVTTNNAEALYEVIKEANAEAAMTGKQP